MAKLNQLPLLRWGGLAFHIGPLIKSAQIINGHFTILLVVLQFKLNLLHER